MRQSLRAWMENLETFFLEVILEERPGARATMVRGLPCVVSWLAPVFLVMGLGIIVQALVLLWREHKYGLSTFEMPVRPAVIGTSLEGVIYSSVRVQPAAGRR